jgi:membrane protein YdbS with pleckstrin-like domain
MFCPQCGQSVSDEMNYCPSCGKGLAATTKESAAAPRRETIYESRADRTREKSGPSVGEDELLWDGTFSGKAMVGEWISAAVLTVVLFAVAPFVGAFPYKQTALFGLLLLAWLIPTARLTVRKLGIRYVLTERRFFHEEGILLRTTNRIDLIDVDDVAVRRSLVGRFVNVGTIVLTSSDKSHPVVALIGIDDPLEVAELIDQACHRERDRRGVYVEQV